MNITKIPTLYGVPCKIFSWSKIVYLYIFKFHDARKGPNYSCPSNLHITKYIHMENVLHMRQGVKREKKVLLMDKLYYWAKSMTS